MPPAKSRCGTCSNCRRRKGKCQTPKGKGKKSELEQLECAISPAAFRAPQEPGAEPLVVRKEPSTGKRKEAKPDCEKGLDPKAVAQISQLKEQLQELDTKQREMREMREKHEKHEQREKRERPEPEPETEQRNRGEQQQRKGSVCSPSLPSLPSLSLLLCSFSFHLPLQGISRHGRPKDQEEEAGPELVGYDAVCVSQHIIPLKETWGYDISKIA